jgi:hypothetical protein
MDTFDTARLRSLAQALHLPPRQLLVAVLRLARDGESKDAGRYRRLLLAARAPMAIAESVATLLMTPVTSFAQDDLDSALTSVWPTPRAMDE